MSPWFGALSALWVYVSGFNYHPEHQTVGARSKLGALGGPEQPDAPFFVRVMGRRDVVLVSGTRDQRVAAIAGWRVGFVLLCLSIYFCYAGIAINTRSGYMSSEMNPNPNPDAINTQQVTVDVPEDRVAEFHAFFARFLAGRGRRGPGGRGPGRRGRYGRHAGRHGGRHGHGHGCGHGHRETPEGETTTEPGQSTEIAEV